MKRAARTPGEPLVWLSSMGLAIGVTMVVGLLGLIVANGLAVFWPSRLTELTVERAGKREILAGMIVMHHAKRGIKASGDETQIYLANKDAYGSTFRYLDDRDIV